MLFAGNTVVSFNDFNDFIHDYSYATTFLQWEVALDLCCPFLLYWRIVRLFRAGYANQKSSGTGITLTFDLRPG